MLSYAYQQDEGAAKAMLQWSAVCGEILRGLTHTLSNRIGFLSVLSANMSADMDDTELSAQLLRDECAKFTTVLDHIRLLPTPVARRGMGTSDEPFSLAQCVDEAVSLLRHDRAGREVVLLVSGTEGLPAVRGRPTELRRALLTLLYTALRDARNELERRKKRGEPGGEALIELSCRADPGVVRLEIRTPPFARELQCAFWSAADYFARAGGAELHPSSGELLRGSGPIVLSFPTLDAAAAVSRTEH